MALRMTRGGMDVVCADDFVVMLAPHCGDGARVAPRTLAVPRCEPKKSIGQTIRTKGALPHKTLNRTNSPHIRSWNDIRHMQAPSEQHSTMRNECHTSIA